jgi:hypothetical protein
VKIAEREGLLAMIDAIEPLFQTVKIQFPLILRIEFSP